MGVVNLRRPCVVGNNLGSRPSDKGPGVPNGTWPRGPCPGQSPQTGDKVRWWRLPGQPLSEHRYFLWVVFLRLLQLCPRSSQSYRSKVYFCDTPSVLLFQRLRHGSLRQKRNVGRREQTVGRRTSESLWAYCLDVGSLLESVSTGTETVRDSGQTRREPRSPAPTALSSPLSWRQSSRSFPKQDSDREDLRWSSRSDVRLVSPTFSGLLALKGPLPSSCTSRDPPLEDNPKGKEQSGPVWFLRRARRGFVRDQGP